jgi:hypothetical protein
MRLLWWVVLALLAGAGAPDLQAQAGAGTASQDTAGLMGELVKVPRGKTIRVGTRSSQLHTGRLADFDAAMLKLESEDRPLITVRLDEITWLRVRGRSTTTGAVIGGVAGLAFGVLAGVVVARIADEDGDPEYASAIAVLGGVFTVAGAGTGAIIGTAIPKWRLKWP